MSEEAKIEEKPAAEGGAKKAPTTFRTLLGAKKGMTQVYDGQGVLRAVTVIEAGPCPIYGVRTKEKHGYAAVQIGFGTKKEKSFTKSELGQFKAVNQVPARFLREFRLNDAKGFEVGQVVDLTERFKPLDYVDVQGTSKGKGFAGVMKRHNFAGLPASHGASDKQRSPGSLAARRSLGRVLPGQRMAGHMGAISSTVQKMEVVKVDAERNLIYVNGSVPGPVGGTVVLSETVKNKKARIIRKVSTVLRDKMGNIIQAKGAKAAAKAQAPKAPEKK